MKLPIIFSTITGNAFKMAEAVKEDVPGALGPYNIRYVNQEMIDLFDTFLLTYWCNHGTADDDTIALLEKMEGKKIIIVGTLGASMESAHAKEVYERVSELVSKKNILLGNFLCRGSIDINRTARKLKIPQGQKGHLTQERFEKQKESLGHPDEADFMAARQAVANFLKNHEE